MKDTTASRCAGIPSLWKSLSAKDPAKAYGVQLSDGQWYWYETWLNRVREHCQGNNLQVSFRRGGVRSMRNNMSEFS